MDFTKITTWVKDNPLMAAAAGIGAIALIAVIISKSSKSQQYMPVPLSGIGRKPNRRKTKKVSLIGLQ